MTEEEYNQLQKGDYVKIIVPEVPWKSPAHSEFAGMIVKITNIRDYLSEEGFLVAATNKLQFPQLIYFHQDDIERISNQEEYRQQFIKSSLDEWSEF